MKKYLLILMLSFLQPLYFTFCKDTPDVGLTDLNFSAEDIKVLEDYINSLTPEERAYYEDLGQKTMDRLGERGIDFERALTDPTVWEDPTLWKDLGFDDIDTELTSSVKPEKPALPQPEPQEEEKQDAAPEKPVILSISDNEKIQAMKHMLEDIAEKIVSLRQKTETKRSLQELIRPFEMALSDILYFVLTIKEDNLVRFFIDKKFEPLQQLMHEIHEILEVYEPQVYVTEFSLEGEDPYAILDVSPMASFEKIYKKYQQLSKEENPLVIQNNLKQQKLSPEDFEAALQTAQQRWDAIVWAFEALQSKENSKQALELILNALQSALFDHAFINKTKEFLKAYDPEALKIKEEQEKKEKKAREEQERLARQRAPWVPTVSSTALKPASYDAPFYTGASFPRSKSSSDMSSKEPGSSSGSSSAGSAGSEGKKPGGKKPQGDKKKDEKGEKEKEATSDKKDKKEDKKSGVERELFRIEDRLETLQETIVEHGPVLATFKEYLAAPFNEVTDKTKARELNAVLTEISQQISALEKRAKKDLDKFKDDKKKENKTLRKTYTDGVRKAYDKFTKHDDVKKALNILNDLTTNEGGILFKNEPLTSDATKRFLVTGTPSRDVPVSAELKRINNPAMVTDEDEEIPAIDYIKNAHDATASFEKLMKDSFSKK